MRSQLRTGDYNSEALITLSFLPQDFSSPETAPEKVDNHEIRWQGKMYDVVSASLANGKLVIRCIPDEKENNLMAGFLQQVKDKMGDKKQGSRQTQFSFWHFVNANSIVFEPMSIHGVDKPAMADNFGYSSYRPGVPVPPPWRVA